MKESTMGKKKNDGMDEKTPLGDYEGHGVRFDAKENNMTKDNRVEVFIPKGYSNEDPNCFVSINGTAYVLPRGKRVMVPHFVAEELHRAERAQQAWDIRSAGLSEQSL